MISKILIPTDFSPAAWQAVRYGLSLAGKHGAKITLLHVYPSENKYMAWLKTSHPDDHIVIKQLTEKLKIFTEELRANNSAKIDYKVISGNVTNEITNYALKEPFDLIIMGVNSGSSHNEPGSNTAEIIRNAGFPVLIIPGIQKEVIAKSG